ncbi:MAG: hypothetical protein JWO53_300 [Chlamydiia bacterium]|nr:hypothetical protein [Chlamydiia bacterium]
MEQTFFSSHLLSNAKMAQTLSENMRLTPSLDFQNDVRTPSYAIIGKKKITIACRDMRLRRKKTFVQKIFLELINKFSEESLQALLYLDFYQELCDGILPHLPGNSIPAHFTHRPMSPYFVSDQKNTEQVKLRHASLKERFLKMASKRCISFKPKDHFQLACTLQSLWEQSVRMIEHQSHFGTSFYQIAEQMVRAAKELPQNFSPFEEKKNLVHISSFKLAITKTRKSKKAKENPRIQEFIEAALHFGYEYFGLTQP